MVKCLHDFSYFTVFLKNRNISFKIKRSKVTDYAALKGVLEKNIIKKCFSSSRHVQSLQQDLEEIC